MIMSVSAAPLRTRWSLLSKLAVRLKRLLALDLLSTARFQIFRKLTIDLRIHRNVSVKLRPSASVTGGGTLHVGYRWPAYCAYKSLLAVWHNASLKVSGRFDLYTGCRVIVDQGACLELGSGYLNSNSSISCFNHIKIGHGVAIAENVTIRDSDNHSILPSDRPQAMPILIGDHVWIGMSCIILKGVTIGDGAVIAAGSLVNKNIPARTLAAGVPARVVRENVTWE